MRQVTATEKFRAVNEGKMAKGEFVRQMRMAHPSVISQWNSYNDTVTILKNKGYITEKTGVESYDSRYDLNISPNSIDRGVRYELAAQGQDPVTVKDKELVAKVTDRVIKNLKKDPLHYINLLAKESSHVDKNDKMKETKRGAQDVDTFNGMKKADLKENVDVDSARENIVKVASVIRAKYSEIPGFNVILKDFLQTHQDDIKAGLVTDPVGEFDDYIELNYDRLDEKEEGNVEEGIGTIALGVAGGLILLKILKFVLKKVVGAVGMNVKLPKEKLLEIVKQTIATALTKISSSGVNIVDILTLQSYLQGEINAGRITTIKQITQVIDKVTKNGLEEESNVSEEYKKGFDTLIEAIKELNTDGDEIGAAQDAMEFIGQHYGIDFEFGRGPSRMAEKKGKDLDGDGDIDSDDYMMAKDKAIKKAMGKDEVVSEMSPEMADVVAFLATGAGIQGASHVAGKIIKALETGRFGEKGKEIAQDIHNLAKTDVEETRNLNLREHVKNIITKVLEEQMINEAATNELARLADDFAEFPGMKQSIIGLQDIVTDIESFYDKTRQKIQKVYDSIGEIRNEEGLKVGGFIAPSIEAAFNKDLRPVTKVGFTGGLETPKVKTMSSREFEDMKQQQGIEEEPKQNVFAPIAESKKKK